jgi:uncharacterized protein with HEPN domain
VSPRDWRFRIEDILESLDRIEQYIKGMDKAAWKKDKKQWMPSFGILRLSARQPVIT